MGGAEEVSTGVVLAGSVDEGAGVVEGASLVDGTGVVLKGACKTREVLAWGHRFLDETHAGQPCAMMHAR